MHAANHFGIMKAAGLQVREYRYFSEQTLGLDYEGLLEDLRVRPVYLCVSLLWLQMY
jgi:aspartate aminotransferase